MKRTISLCLGAALLAGVLAGCTGEEEPSSAQARYRDGSYTARFDTAGEDGYTAYAAVTVENDVVTVTGFDGENAAGEKRSADSALADEMAQASPENLPEPMTPALAGAEAIRQFDAAGGDPEAMRFVAGAPEYGEDLRVLVQAVLDGPASDPDGTAAEVTVPWYADGEYRVEVAEFDLSGYKEYVVLTVSGGVPAVTEFDGYDEDGALRSADTEINPTVPYSESVPALVDSFNAGGTVESIETVTGATESSDAFRLLVERALENAHARGPAEDAVDVTGDGDGLRDGVYRAEMADFENGWKDCLTAAVYRGEVQILELDSENEAGDRKSTDSGFADAPAGDPKAYLQRIVDAYYNADGDLAGMVNIAGATVSTNNFKLMLGELLGSNMLTGDTETRTVALLTEEEVTAADEELSSSESASESSSSEDGSSSAA